MRSLARLAGRDSGETRTLATLDPMIVRRAITARPLDQALINVAMVRDTMGKEGGNGRTRAWVAALANLGWRDTPSLRNRLYVAAQAQDIGAILDISDALLRRRQLLDQILPVVVLTETDDRTRSQMASRLAGRPNWREFYLQATGVLTTPEQVAARFALLRDLIGRGSRLSSSEADANAAALDRGGRPDLGHALWAATRPGVTEPLDDLHFARAARRTEDDVLAPYAWNLFTGEGYGAEAFVENGRPRLEIRWNGRGVPVFARQRTAARPGRYALAVDAPPESATDLAAIAFRLVCDDGTVALRRVAPARFVTEAPVRCSYPTLEIAGDLQAGASPRQLVIQGLRLDPTGDRRGGDGRD